MIKLISFDLQGTLSSAKFSDDFWLEILPRKYATFHNTSIESAKKELREEFKKFGKYDFRYYDNRYWEKVLKFDTKQEFKKLESPKLCLELLDFIKSLPLPHIIFSTTTYDFIYYELGEFSNLFDTIISTLDDYHIAGKSEEAYRILAKNFNLLPKEILHIGDNKIMDIDNAQKVGLQTIYFDSLKSIADLIEQIRGKL